MTKVLLLCEFGCANKNSTGHLVSQIPDLLDGVDVEIIDTSDMPLPFRRLYEAIERGNSNGVLKKIVALFGLVCAFLMRSGRYDQIVVVSNPFITLLIPPALWRIKGPRLNYLLFDLFPETFKVTNISIPALAYQVVEKMRNQNLRRADNVFVIGRDMKRHLRAHNIEENVVYVPLWIGATEATKPVTSSIVGSPSPVGKICLNFFGNIGQVQNFEEVFRLLDSNLLLSLEVYGGGAKLRTIEEESQGRAKFFGAVPFLDRGKIFEQGGIGLVPQPISLVGLAVPSKAFYYWSRGLPVLYLGSPDSELGQMITEAPELGLVVAPGGDFVNLYVDLQAAAENKNSEKIVLICKDLRDKAKVKFKMKLCF